MKTFISFLIGAIIVGLVLFAILHWLFKIESKNAGIASFGGAFADFVISYVRQYRNNRKKNTVKDHF
jgi:prolipoprotein diacylglyceryltransferase